MNAADLEESVEQFLSDFRRSLREHKTRKGIGCGRCRIPDSTIIAVLEAELKQKVPGIKKVESVK